MFYGRCEGGGELSWDGKGDHVLDATGRSERGGTRCRKIDVIITEPPGAILERQRLEYIPHPTHRLQPG